MNKFVIIGVLVVVFLGGIFLGKNEFTAFTVKEDAESLDNYSWTKAICNDNQCIDVLIECSDGKVVNLEPMSNPINISLNWSDPRGENSTKLCGV
jgi:hypothetical protein